MALPELASLVQATQTSDVSYQTRWNLFVAPLGPLRPSSYRLTPPAYGLAPTAYGLRPNSYGLQAARQSCFMYMISAKSRTKPSLMFTASIGAFDWAFQVRTCS